MVSLPELGPVLCGSSRHRMHCGATRLHQPELLWLWADGQEEPECAHTLLSALWADSGSGPERGTEHLAGSPPYPGAQENGSGVTGGNAWGQRGRYRWSVSSNGKSAG